MWTGFLSTLLLWWLGRRQAAAETILDPGFCAEGIGYKVRTCKLTSYIYKGLATDLSALDVNVAGVTLGNSTLGRIFRHSNFNIHWNLYLDEASSGDKELCANADDTPVIFTWRNHYNPWHLLMESMIPIYISLLNAGLEESPKIQLVEIQRPGSMGVAAKTHWEGAYEALFGLKQISIEELGTGTKCFKCAIMAFDMGTFMSDELTTDQNLNLHHVLSSFRSWAFARLPLADHVHDSRRLSVINRSNWRQLLNGDKIVSMAKSQGWQAQEVIMEQLSFLDQLSVIRKSAIMIGPHGAAMAFQLIFMHPNAVAVEVKAYLYGPEGPDGQSNFYKGYFNFAQLCSRTLLVWHNRHENMTVVRPNQAAHYMYSYKAHDTLLSDETIQYLLDESSKVYKLQMPAREPNFGVRSLNAPCMSQQECP